jgi:hypothetical protein
MNLTFFPWRKSTGMEDRRKNPRYTLYESCIVNHSTTVGTIIDICRGGLSCSCLDHEQCSHSRPGKIDIFCKKNNYWAATLPVDVLESNTIPGKFIKEFRLRKCRMRFQELSDVQLAQIDSIIRNFANI